MTDKQLGTNTTPLAIRQEVPADYPTVYYLVKNAFATMEHSDGTEQDLVERLRQDEAFIPELSLVAELDGIIVGHIMFTKSKIGDRTELTLAPLSVGPSVQKCGIGGALIREGHRIAKEMGYRFSILVGHENYYPRFGYEPASRIGLTCPLPVKDANFMACNLRQDNARLPGELVFPAAFDIENNK